MTFSILARDAQTGAIGGAAATGSLCVGGWVLRGDVRGGVSACQGAAPSTFWGEDILALLRAGQPADSAVPEICRKDAGREWRQLSALGLTGPGAAFTGALNTPAMGSLVFENGVAAGNMLADTGVLDAMVAGFCHAAGAFSARLLMALRAAQAAGSDSRGLFSAALLVLHPDHAPLTLRVDYHPDDPIGALSLLHDRATTGEYADWARKVPSLGDPERGLEP